MKKAPSPNVGDVVVVPVSDGRAGVGQVVGHDGGKACFYFVLFDFVLDDTEDRSRATEALARPIVLFALTLDALIHHRYWHVVSNAPVVDNVPWPAHKVSVGTHENVVVRDHRGVRERQATEVEAFTMPYQTTVAPIRVQDSLEAHLGLRPWDEETEQLKVDRIIRADEVFADELRRRRRPSSAHVGRVPVGTQLRDDGAIMTRIWLNGDRWNRAYLFDPATGRHQAFRDEKEIGRTAGNGSWMSGRFVATYVGSPQGSIWVQVGQRRYPVDGSTWTRAKVSRVGLWSRLTLGRPGSKTLRLRQVTIYRAVMRWIDWGWDGLDELMADDAAGIHALVNSPDSQDSYLQNKDRAAGPWHLLDGSAAAGRIDG